MIVIETALVEWKGITWNGRIYLLAVRFLHLAKNHTQNKGLLEDKKKKNNKTVDNAPMTWPCNTTEDNILTYELV